MCTIYTHTRKPLNIKNIYFIENNKEIVCDLDKKEIETNTSQQKQHNAGYMIIIIVPWANGIELMQRIIMTSYVSRLCLSVYTNDIFRQMIRNCVKPIGVNKKNKWTEIYWTISMILKLTKLLICRCCQRIWLMSPTCIHMCNSCGRVHGPQLQNKINYMTIQIKLSESSLEFIKSYKTK